MKIITILCGLAVLISCKSRNEKIFAQAIKELTNKEVKFYHDDKYVLNGRDTVLNKMQEGQYKLVVFADSSSCEMCDFKLGEWDLKRKEIMYYNKDVNFMMIIQSKDYHSFEHLAHEEMPDFPFVYDPDAIFLKKNNIPPQHQLHTFLLDSDNKIVLVGTPIGNGKMWNLYKEQIKLK